MGEESFRIVSEEINLETMVNAFLDALKSLSHGQWKRRHNGRPRAGGNR